MLFFACSSPPPSLPLGRPGSEGKEEDAPALVKKVTLMSSTCSLSSFPLPPLLSEAKSGGIPGASSKSPGLETYVFAQREGRGGK